MSISFVQALKTSALAAYGLALMVAESPKESATVTRAQRGERENLANIVQFSSTPTPRIERIQIHHIIDKNGDGKFQAPEEIERIYADSSLKYNLIVREPIPPKGYLAVVVPQDPYWGTTIDLEARETVDGKTISSRIYTNCVDLTMTNATNSYQGKPQTITIVTPEKRKSAYEQRHGATLIEKRTYHLKVMGKDGITPSYSCMFTVDYGATTSSTNTVPALVRGHNEENP